MPGNGSPVPFPPTEGDLLPLPPPPDPPAPPGYYDGFPPVPPPGAVIVPAGKAAELATPCVGA